MTPKHVPAEAHQYSANNITELAGNAFNRSALYVAMSVMFAITGRSIHSDIVSTSFEADGPTGGGEDSDELSCVD